MKRRRMRRPLGLQLFRIRPRTYGSAGYEMEPDGNARIILHDQCMSSSQETPIPAHGNASETKVPHMGSGSGQCYLYYMRPDSYRPLTEAIGDNIIVPKRFFKVILSPYASPPRGIRIHNEQRLCERGMQRAAVSIDEVEAATGHNFFSFSPTILKIKSSRNTRFHNWSVLK